MRPTSATGPDRSAVRRAVELATRAPSLGNAQPWRWAIGAEHREVELYLDERRCHSAVDPDHREMIISCGAALHHLLVALAAAHISADVRRFPDPDRPGLLARVELAERPPDPDAGLLAEAIGLRRSDRRPFGSWPVPAELIGELRELARIAGLAADPIRDPDLRWTVYRAITEAARIQAGQPDVVAEQDGWNDRGPEARDGIPAANAAGTHRAAGQPPMRTHDTVLGERPPSVGAPENSALVLVSTPTDSPVQWLRAGETASALLLTVTRDGLASSILTQPLEVADTRARLRTRVAPSWWPQLLIRIGWPAPDAPPLPATPRRPLTDVLTEQAQTNLPPRGATGQAERAPRVWAHVDRDGRKPR